MQSAIEQRVDLFLGLVGIVFPLAMQYYLWTAVFASSVRAEVYGYTYNQMITYVLCSNLILKFVSVDGLGYKVVDDIKNGGLSKYIIKPIGYLRYRTSCFFGEKFLYSVFIVLVFAIVIAILMGYCEFQAEVRRLLLFIVSLVFALGIKFLMYFSIIAIAFLIEEVASILFAIQILIDIFGGAIIPLDIFGEKWEGIFRLLPFQYIIYYPASIIDGRLPNSEIMNGIVMQCVWIVILAVLAKIVWLKCIKRYIAVGG